jgi:cytidine deaminase
VSYGLTICAERVAVMSAVAAGLPVIHRLAVWAKNTAHHAVTPCGACRQVLAEFMPPEGMILIADKQASPRQISLKTFLPEAFSNENLL